MNTSRDPIALIMSIARKFPQWDRDELISAGHVAYVQALRDFDGRGTFDGYAAMRVKYAMQDALRAWNMGSRHSHRLDPPRFEPLSRDHEDPRALEPRLIAALTTEAALKALPPRLRKAVRLCYFADYTHREIAAAIGVGPDRVAQLLREAKTRMAA